MKKNAKGFLIGTVAAAFVGLCSYVFYDSSQNLSQRDRPREGRTMHSDFMYDLDKDGLVDVIRRSGDMRYLAAAKGYEEHAEKYLRVKSFHIMSKEERDLASRIMVLQEKLETYMQE